MISKPLFDAGTVAFGISFALAVLGVRAAVRAVLESDLPLVGGSS